MTARTFSAPSMAEAMRQIRDDLGAEAVIVSSHQSERGRGVQVTAAIDEDANLDSDVDVESELFAPDGANEQDHAPTLDEDILFQSLLYHDVPEQLAERLVRTGRKAGLDDPVEALAIGLDRYLEFHSLDQMARPTMLVGPAGSGKSITLVKLAAEAALRGEAAAVLTTDTVRAGALAQLSGYTDIMQQPLMEADTPETLHAAILNQPNVRLLIDTPSTNPYNADELADLSRFIDVCDVDPVLVLPAGLNAQDAADMAAIFSRLGCRTLIATQLDVARRLGAILAAAQGGNLALSVVSISPSIAKGLTPLNPMSLARVLLRDPGESHAYEQTGVRQA